MTSPSLNFVWVGEPRFTQGGQDVLGPESFDRNFKIFAQEHPNPMIFWCQQQYCEVYADYFKSKTINIKTASIEQYLQTCSLNRESAEFLLQEYSHTILDKSRNQTIDRVYFKDMFFNYILATQGNYVLDTNVQADLSVAVTVMPYPTFMFPCLEHSKRTSAPEVWMQYAPPEDLSRAKKCLLAYISLYKKAAKLIDGKFYTPQHHKLAGIIAVNALLIQDEPTKLSNALPISQYQQDPSYQVWATKTGNVQASIPALCIIKEYYNSHLPNRDMSFSAPHAHVLDGLLQNLLFDLNHGINPDLQSNSFHSVDKLDYDMINATLLHIAMSRFFDSENHKKSAQLLLERGANPNKICTLTRKDISPYITTEETPLTFSIKSRQEGGVVSLFQYSQHKINLDLVLNGYSPLLLAIACNTGIEILLHNGANPNQSWDWQTETPLTLAVRKNNIKAVTLLLMNNPPADINRPYTNKSGNTVSATPLHIALKLQSEPLVKLLIEQGADLSAVLIYRNGTDFLEKKTRDIRTSQRCTQLLDAALLKQKSDSDDIASSPRP